MAFSASGGPSAIIYEGTEFVICLSFHTFFHDSFMSKQLKVEDTHGDSLSEFHLLEQVSVAQTLIA
jgi:hypothetical protein